MLLWPFEDANSKLLDFFSVADVDAEERVTTFWSIFWSWGLLEIFNLNFGHDIEVILVRSSKLKFGQDFEADLCLSFWA